MYKIKKGGKNGGKNNMPTSAFYNQEPY